MDPTKSDPSDISNTSNSSDKTQVPAAPKLKEQGPAFTAAAIAESDKIAKEEKDEYWENYSREIELEKQVLEMGGVEKIESGEVKVPDELAKEMGIKPAITEQTAVSSQTGFSVGGVSLDDNQLTSGLSKPTSSGFRWLVEWFIYQLLKAHYHIKRVKGKILRLQPISS